MEPFARKESLCRFYLRGLCIKTAKECDFSHGVSDLNYKPWQEGEQVQYEYLADNDFTQKKAIKGPRIYKNLFDFSHKYSLQQLNEDRALRLEIRKQMHHQLFEEFMGLLEHTYPGALLNEEFLIRQYTRAGFNKLMTRIKFSHLTEHLCDHPNSVYYKDTVNKKMTIKKRAHPQEIEAFYKEECDKAIKEGVVEESELKKRLFQAKRPENVPPMSIVLKDKKISFQEYLQELNGGKQIQIEVTLDILLEQATAYLLKILPYQLIQWNNVFQHLSKTLKCNNGNLINQIKPHLVLIGFQFLFFPMLNLITHQDCVYKFPIDVCHCQYTDKFSLEGLLETLHFEELLEEESIDIVDMDSLMKCIPHLLQSKMIGVDLEGRLRKNGYIEMIQLNNGRNTFLIDIYQMDLNGDVDTFSLLKQILRNIMVDDTIVKIFHDCRHDSLALHQFMQTCVKNVFDTSAVETYINQVDSYREIQGDAKKAKEAIAVANNVRTPGLNEILKKYNAPHGINRNKDRFHKMWSEGQTSFFDTRPLDPEYRQYCIKDVLDLLYVRSEMCHSVQDIYLARWVSSHYVKFGHDALQK